MRISVDPICTCACAIVGISNILWIWFLLPHRKPRWRTRATVNRLCTSRVKLLNLLSAHLLMAMGLMLIVLCLFPAILLYLYVRLNDAKLMQLPRDVASAFSPKRISATDALEAAAAWERVSTTLRANAFLPPRTGRRYIVVGGVGFVTCPLWARVAQKESLGRLSWRVDCSTSARTR